MQTLYLEGPFIQLAQALKRADWVSTGGEAKIRIQSGEVVVNGEIETRRGKKLYAGDQVEWEGETLVIHAPEVTLE